LGHDSKRSVVLAETSPKARKVERAGGGERAGGRVRGAQRLRGVAHHRAQALHATARRAHGERSSEGRGSVAKKETIDATFSHLNFDESGRARTYPPPRAVRTLRGQLLRSQRQALTAAPRVVRAALGS
jgi:hypothetical protein